MSKLSIPVPQRRYLLHQVTETLRQLIQQGQWKAQLPGERELSQLLHVSRPTLRTALEILTREKVIVSEPGKPRKILLSARKRRSPRKRVVYLLTPIPLYELSRNRLFLFDRLYQDLLKHDIKFEILHHVSFSSNRPAQALKLIEERKDHGVFLLTRASEVVQREVARLSLPVLILGSAFSGVALPSIECDYPAMGRHAAGLLLSRGHRRVIVFHPESPPSGDLQIVHSFQREFLRDPSKKAICKIFPQKSEPRDFLSQWNELRCAMPEVTAVLSIYPLPCLLVQTASQKDGVESPALLSCNTAPFCAWAQPTLAHYQLPLSAYASRLLGILHELIHAGALPQKHTTIMPEFVSGDSLPKLDEALVNSPPLNLQAGQHP